MFFTPFSPATLVRSEHQAIKNRNRVRRMFSNSISDSLIRKKEIEMKRVLFLIQTSRSADVWVQAFFFPKFKGSKLKFLRYASEFIAPIPGIPQIVKNLISRLFFSSEKLFSCNRFKKLETQPRNQVCLPFRCFLLEIYFEIRFQPRSFCWKLKTTCFHS